jgi:2-polyprenyl-3-methyl-5-hydroxy-6-metoxy-1,4-benzoquinol methylase
MPTSYKENIPQILDIIEELKPKTILDVGFGRGKYGFLVREYFHDIEIDGIEIFEPYVTPAHRQTYRDIKISNALESWPISYDLILLIDVIEHWPKDKAKRWLSNVVDLGAKVLVSTPCHDIPQGAVNGNEWEAHVSHWNINDFSTFEYKEYLNPLSLTVLVG